MRVLERQDQISKLPVGMRGDARALGKLESLDPARLAMLVDAYGQPKADSLHTISVGRNALLTEVLRTPRTARYYALLNRGPQLSAVLATNDRLRVRSQGVRLFGTHFVGLEVLQDLPSDIRAEQAEELADRMREDGLSLRLGKGLPDLGNRTYITHSWTQRSSFREEHRLTRADSGAIAGIHDGEPQYNPAGSEAAEVDFDDLEYFTRHPDCKDAWLSHADTLLRLGEIAAA